MSVTSFSFFAGFVLSPLVYYLIPKRFQWVSLLGFSTCFFLLASNPWTLVYLLASSFATWFAAFRIGSARADETDRRAFQILPKMLTLFWTMLVPVAGVLVNLGIIWLLEDRGVLTLSPGILAIGASLSLIFYFLLPKRFRRICLLLFSVLLAGLSISVWSPTPRMRTKICGAISLAAILLSLICIVRARKGRKCERPEAAEDDGSGPAGQEKAVAGERGAKSALILGILVNIGILAVLKYNGFFISNLNALFHLSIPLPELAAPIGISFYTLSAVGYLLSCYWGNTAPQKNLAKTALFVSYYPILTSGPILRYEEMESRLFGTHFYDSKAVAFGMQRMLWGLFLKLVVSARLAIAVDTIYGNPEAYPGLFVWIAAALFMLQLYTDFSGCMEIIIGASECYGITLPENFRTPFFSRSVQEFWQRWHITLGAWMRDYILYPVLRTNLWKRMTKWMRAHWGKKAAKQIPNYLGMLCVWLLIGLWHGGGWKYIIGQGLWFWACITLSKALAPIFKKINSLLHVDPDRFSWHLFQSLRVFILVSIGNMFFRLDSIKATLQAWRSGFSTFNLWIFFDGSLNDTGLPEREWQILIFGLVILLATEIIKEMTGKNIRELIARQGIIFRWFIWICLGLIVAIYGKYGSNYDAAAFIYAGF